MILFYKAPRTCSVATARVESNCAQPKLILNVSASCNNLVIKFRRMKLLAEGKYRVRD